MLKRWLRRGALGGGVFYLLLGPLYLGVGERGVGADGAVQALPMASWTIQEIEARNRSELLRVSGAVASAGRAGGAEASGRLLPDLVMLEPSDLSTVGSRAEGDLRLKFTTLIWNAGLGPLETRGAENPSTGELEVYQYVYQQPEIGGQLGPETGDARTGEAPPEALPPEALPPELQAEQGRQVGTFNFDHRHGHLHFDGFAHYELWRVGESGELLEVVAENAKVGFCLMDIKHMASSLTHLGSGLVGEPGGPVYAGCREDVQGISVGWGDEYLSLLYEQDLDLTGVPDGAYAVVATTNPDRTIEELDYENNAAVTYLRLEEGSVVWSSEGEMAGS